MSPRVLLILLVVVGVVAPPASGGKDAFAALKQRLASAPCVRLEFLNIVDSDVFGRVDSTRGSAQIARDGRYVVRWGDDVFLFDGSHRHSYSAANNQVTVEAVDSVTAMGDIAWITKIDAYYRTETIKRGVSYRLIRVGDTSDLPDSVTVTIDSHAAVLKQLSYRDQNEDLNLVSFIKQTLDSSCSPEAFVPGFPDSVDVVRLD